MSCPNKNNGEATSDSAAKTVSCPNKSNGEATSESAAKESKRERESPANAKAALYSGVPACLCVRERAQRKRA